jgi:hypothetical protein
MVIVFPYGRSIRVQSFGHQKYVELGEAQYSASPLFKQT